ncbi:MAG: RDD family protein [Verrucomicrobiota bacterium]
MLGRTTTLQIRTPEGVSFQLPLASPFPRCLALAIDFAVIIGLTLIVSTVLSLITSFTDLLPGLGRVIADFSKAFVILLNFVLSLFYYMTLEWLWRGKTVGKRALKLRVIDERGLTLTFKQVAIRNIFRFLDILPVAFYMVGGLSCAVTKRCQRLGDLAGGTLVVREIAQSQPEIESLISDHENSFSQHPHLEGRLRQNTTPEEARIALDAITRRDELDETARLRVFREIADYFREITPFPEETTIGLSDEQYVRNVAETLFRKAKV